MKFEDLPIFKLPDMSKFASTEQCFERIKKNGSFIISLWRNLGMDVPLHDGIRHVDGIDVYVAPSCIPGSSRLNIKFDLRLFDVFHLTSMHELCSEIYKTIPVDAVNDMAPIVVAISKRLSLMFMLRQAHDKQWLVLASSIHELRLCDMLKVKSYAGVSLYDEARTYRNLNSFLNSLGLILLNDNVNNYAYCIPITSSNEDQMIIQPYFELSNLHKNLKDAEKLFNKMKMKMKSAEDNIEQFMIYMDLNA